MNCFNQGEGFVSKTKKVLVIGDAHAAPNQCLKRFNAAGRLAAEARVDAVVDIGDFADMESLLDIESGRKSDASIDGKRLDADIAAAVEARDRFKAGMDQKAKGKRWKPRLVATIGNHEGPRIDRLKAVLPQIGDLVNVDDLGYSQYGWEAYPHFEPAWVEGVAFCHSWKARASSRPIGGVNFSRAVSNAYPGEFSRVSGHSHKFSVGSFSNGMRGSSPHYVIEAGCFFNVDSPLHAWARGDVSGWTSGLLLLEVQDAYVRGVNFIDYARVLKEWAK